MAAEAGLEPATFALTARRSTFELLGNNNLNDNFLFRHKFLNLIVEKYLIFIFYF